MKQHTFFDDPESYDLAIQNAREAGWLDTIFKEAKDRVSKWPKWKKEALKREIEYELKIKAKKYLDGRR